MAYNKIGWISGKTPLSATNFNKMENGIEKNSNDIAQLSNPNLLINSDFRNPINQRGQTTYTSDVDGWAKCYTIDRWYIQYSGKIEVYDGYIKFSNTSTTHGGRMSYMLEKPLYLDDYTLSLNVKKFNGNFEIIVYDANSNTTRHNITSIGVNTFNVNSSIQTIVLECNAGASIEIEYIKLEQGSIATPFVPRLYGEELALCQRYYERITLTHYIPCSISTATTSKVVIPVTPKRVKPTIGFSNVSVLLDNTETEWKVVSGLVTYGGCANESVCPMQITHVSLNTTSPRIFLIQNAGYVEFDAEMY